MIEIKKKHSKLFSLLHRVSAQWNSEEILIKNLNNLLLN